VSAECHVSHGPELAPPLFTFIHQQARAPLSLLSPMSSPNTSSQGLSFLYLPPLHPHAFVFSLSHNHHFTTLLSKRPSSYHFRWGSHSTEGFSARARAQALSSPFTTPRSASRITVAYINPIITNLRVSDPHSIALNPLHLAGNFFFSLSLFSFIFYSATATTGLVQCLLPLACSPLNVPLPNIYPQSLLFVRYL